MSKSIEIICVLDRSASMASMHAESVASINSYLKDQKEAGIKAKVTIRVFDSQHDIIRDRVKLSEVQPIGVDEAPPRCMTSLNDAVGKAINEADQSKPTIVIISTDGQENTSEEFTTEQVKKLVKEREAAGWKFLFFGAGVDAFSAGGGYGMAAGSYQNVSGDAAGMATRGATMTLATTTFFDANQKPKT